MDKIAEFLRALYRNLFAESTFYEDQHGPNRRRRVLNTILLLLAFRVLADIPVLNVDEERLHQLLADNPLLGLIDLLAGGEVLTKFSIVAAGIFPYLAALMIAYGATWLVPSLRAQRMRSSEGDELIKKIAKWLTLPLAFAFAYALSHYLSRQTGLFPGQIHWFTWATFFPSLWIVCLVTLGSVLSSGIANWITRKGVGPGENMVLLAGSSLVLAKQLGDIARNAPDVTHAMQSLAIAIAGVALLVVLSFGLVTATRNFDVNSAKRQLSAGRPNQATLPFLLNSGGIVPVTGAIGLLMLLQLARTFVESHFGSSIVLGAWLTPDSGWYWAVLAGLIVLFTYVCNFSVILPGVANDEPSLAERIKKKGFFVSSFKPGTATEDLFSRTMMRISLFGGLGMAFLAAGVPYLVLRLTQRDILVTVLTVIIIVKTLVPVRAKFEADGTMESYGSFPKRGRVRR